MAARSSLLLLAALVMVVAHAAGASVSAPAPAVDCSDALISLAGCLSYVQEGSTVATPEESCCSGLKDVVRKEVACLCQAFQGGQDYGVTLNMTKALQLPGACKVKTPPFSKCHISMPGVAGGSPAPAPAPSSGAPFFDGSPSPSTPSAGSPAGTGARSGDSTTARAPSPSASAAAATFPASANVLLAAATIAATLLM